MAPTPSPRPSPHHTPKTPNSKRALNLHFPANSRLPTNSVEHPVEVVGRIRTHPDQKDTPFSVLEIPGDGRSVRVKTETGGRDFSLDGVSVSENENLEGFYRRFVESRVVGVRSGAKCTIMMYGPTGSGKSFTMFGGEKEQGIVYRALRDILGDGDGGEFGIGMFVQVAMLEIYNEEIYDLLAGDNSKGGSAKVRLEVMGKKAKNASYMSGNEAGKISREVAKVEKRRIVKSTRCNERSSRSHCLIILDVPSVGGRLMLVDMAGSENIEAAGQTGFEAKMQTAKINQGNIALKRVVESIANGDSHVPFRDSKLTMLLQDSFEDDKSKILMVLCASPDPKEMHKTISTFEYGAKAKCIVRASHMAIPKDLLVGNEESTLLKARIASMNQFIYKLQLENKIKEKECYEAQKELQMKEDELAKLKTKLGQLEGKMSTVNEEDINMKVDQRTRVLRDEMMKMQERMLAQQEELKNLQCQLEEVYLERGNAAADAYQGIGAGVMKRLLTCAREQGMEKSMDIDMGDQQTVYDVKEIKADSPQHENCWKPTPMYPSSLEVVDIEEQDETYIDRLPEKVSLSTVFEKDEEDDTESSETEIDKEVVEECLESTKELEDLNPLVDSLNLVTANCMKGDSTGGEYSSDPVKNVETGNAFIGNYKDSTSARKARIQNIFRLCGNYREVAQQVNMPTPPKKGIEDYNNQHSPVAGKENLAVERPALRQYNSVLSDLKQNQSPKLAKDQKSGEKLIKRFDFSEVPEDSKENITPVVVKGDALSEVNLKQDLPKDSGSLNSNLTVLTSSMLAH